MSKNTSNKKINSNSIESKKMTLESEILNKNISPIKPKELKTSLSSVKTDSDLTPTNAAHLTNIDFTQIYGTTPSTFASAPINSLSATQPFSSALSTFGSSLASSLGSTQVSNTALTTFGSSLASSLGSAQVSYAAHTAFGSSLANSLGSTQVSNAALTTFGSSLASSLGSAQVSNAALTAFGSSLANPLGSTQVSNAALTTFGSSLASSLSSTQISNTALTAFGSSLANSIDSTQVSNSALTAFGSSLANSLGSTKISSALSSIKDGLSPIITSASFSKLDFGTFVGIDATTLSTALKTIMPYKSTELYIDKSVSLDDTTNNSLFFSDTNEILNSFIDAKEIGKNIILHNASNITQLNSVDASHFSLDLAKYTPATFLLDTSLLDTNEKALTNYINSTMMYINKKNIGQYSNDVNQIISIGSNGTELIDSKNNETYIIEDICLVDDIIGIEQLTHDELVNFYRFIYKYPMLAMDDDYGIGKKIYNLIRENYESYLINESNLILYRARKYERNEQMPYCENDVYLAPYGVSRRGRFNSPEMNHLYLSTDLDATLQELDAKTYEKFAILKCKPKHNIRLFDLTRGDYSLQNFCLKNTIESNKKEYIFPNFISNCCRRAGYEGIKYRSVKDSTQINYVLFEHSMGNFETIEFCDYIIEAVDGVSIRYTKTN